MPLRALAFGHPPHTLPATTPAGEAFRRMAEWRVNHVALVDAAGRFVGLAGAHAALERILPAPARAGQGLDDLAFAGDALPMLTDHLRALAGQPAATLVVPGAPVLRADTPLLEAALLLARARAPLPVVNGDGVLLGILGPRALLAFLASQAH